MLWCSWLHWHNFTLKSGGYQWRRQDLVSGGHDYRAGIKAPSMVAYGEECPLPSPLGGLLEHPQLHQRGLGRSPAAIAFCAYFRPQKLRIAWKIANSTLKKWWWQSPPLSKVVVTSHRRHIQSCTYASLVGRKGIRPVKIWVMGCWHSYLSRARCRLAYGPADATATHCLLLQ